MAVNAPAELADKYPQWNISMVGTLNGDRIPLGVANPEDSYVCVSVNNPNSGTVYRTAAYPTPLEAANAMDLTLASVGSNVKFASVNAKLRVTGIGTPMFNKQAYQYAQFGP